MNLSMFHTQSPVFVPKPPFPEQRVLPPLPADLPILEQLLLPVQLPLLEQPGLMGQRLRLEHRPLVEQRVNAGQKSKRKGRKAKTAAKHAAIAKKKSMTKKAKKPAAKQKQGGNAHNVFLKFAKSVVLKGNKSNLCNTRMVLSAEKAVARLKKALAIATA